MDWNKAINARQILASKGSESRPKAPPKIDQEVSKIVGRPVAVNDPKLIAEVMKWRQYSKEDKMDNHLSDPNKVNDLKRIFG